MNTKFSRFVCAALVFLTVSFADDLRAEDDPSFISDINHDLSLLLDEEKLAGIVWSTNLRNKTFSGSAGLSNLDKNLPMTKASAIHVGSVTKTLLAIGVLRLVTTSKLSLDTEVATLLTGIDIKSPWQAETPVRLRHILDHTAGLDNLRMWQFLNSTATADTPLGKTFPSTDPSILKLRSRPGSQYSYSNMGYVLLAMVIEKATHRRYEDYLDRELLGPLAMHRSTFHFTHQSQINNTLLAMGHLENEQAITAIASYLRPAGQFTTTAPDMAKFSAFLLGDGSLNGKQFIAPEMMSQLAFPSTTDAAKAGLKIGHGLALAAHDRHGVIAHCHPGTTFEFRANLCVFPDQGKSFFYAINTDNETADYERITEFFIRKLSLTERIPIATPIRLDPENMQRLEGFYLPSPNNIRLNSSG
jgi:CubicO group peptidase (beta-lactamase class C family)